MYSTALSWLAFDTDQLVRVLVLILVLAVVWGIFKFVFKLAMRMFVFGCGAILVLGVLLALLGILRGG
jgi:hypothetical protein